MKIGILAALALPLALSGCMHGSHRCGMRGDEDGMGTSMNPRKRQEQLEKTWPTVRLDGLSGARVKMDRGVFGDGIDVRAPFEGKFQPTGATTFTGYPLEIELDGVQAQLYGRTGATTIYGRMLVSESEQRRGVLVLEPSECAMKALMDGDIEELRVTASELPRADVACEIAKGGPPGQAPVSGAATGAGMAGGCPMHGGGMAAGCPMHAAGGMHGGCPMHATGAMHGGCPRHGGRGMHGGCGRHGGGAQGGCGHHDQGAGATLVLRVTKFQ